MTQKIKRTIFIICVFVSSLTLTLLSGCSENDSFSRHFDSVDHNEAEAFAKQLAAKVKNGDKTDLYDSCANMKAVAASHVFMNEDVPSFLKSPTLSEENVFIESVQSQNRLLFDALEHMELQEIRKKGETSVIVMN